MSVLSPLIAATTPSWVWVSVFLCTFGIGYVPRHPCRPFQVILDDKLRSYTKHHEGLLHERTDQLLPAILDKLSSSKLKPMNFAYSEALSLEREEFNVEYVMSNVRSTPMGEEEDVVVGCSGVDESSTRRNGAKKQVINYADVYCTLSY